MVEFIGATFRIEGGAPVDQGEGIYGFSRFFRAEGSYYFPNTCNVWTLKALKAAGLPVTPVMGIREENVMDQAAKFGTATRRAPGRSRISVLIAAAIAGLAGWKLRNGKRPVLWAWGSLVLAVVSIAAVTMMAVNQVDHPGWLAGAAAFACWAAVALVFFAHFHALRKGALWRHSVPGVAAILVILIGLSPL